jgi:hypothetical protein
MRRQEREGRRNQPFCGPGSSAVAGGPEGKAPTCQEETKEAAADPQVTGAVDATGEDVPPLPEAKPADGPAKATSDKAGVKKAKTKSRTKSAKRAFQREVDRFRSFFDD